MIDAGRKRPAFFFGLVAKRSGQSAAGGAARGLQLADPAFQLAAVPAFHDIVSVGRKGREDRREEERRRRWKEMEIYLLNE